MLRVQLTLHPQKKLLRRKRYLVNAKEMNRVSQYQSKLRLLKSREEDQSEIYDFK